jgi:glyoxylase-like metal-dependent hydrolase (beta-lactamase superfamily II)
MTHSTPLVAAVALALAPCVAAATEALAPGVTVVFGPFVAGRQPDGNSVVLTGSDSVVVVDSGRHAAHTEAVVAAVRASGRPLAAVVNSHWHLDHIGGNALLRREFPTVRVLASAAFAGARTGFLAGYRRDLEGAVAGAEGDTAAAYRAELALLADLDRLAPDEVVAATVERTLGGRRLTIGVATDAVTAADLWVLDQPSGVLAAGDLVTFPAPLLDTACPSGWAKALEQLAAVDFTRLVPGHGPVLDRAGFTAWREAYVRLLACAAGDGPAAACVDGWLAALRELDPAADVALARSLLDYYLGAILRADPPPAAARCGT